MNWIERVTEIAAASAEALASPVHELPARPTVMVDAEAVYRMALLQLIAEREAKRQSQA